MNGMRTAPAGALGLLLLVACANTQNGVDTPATNDGQIVTQPTVALECQPSPRMPARGPRQPLRFGHHPRGGPAAAGLLWPAACPGA
jgi:hypothetical protein